MMDDNKYGFPYGGSPYPRSNGGYPPQYPPQQRTPYPPVQQPQQGQMPGQGMDKMLEGTQILTGEGFKPLQGRVYVADGMSTAIDMIGNGEAPEIGGVALET